MYTNKCIPTILTHTIAFPTTKVTEIITDVQTLPHTTGIRVTSKTVLSYDIEFKGNWSFYCRKMMIIFYYINYIYNKIIYIHIIMYFYKCMYIYIYIYIYMYICIYLYI